MDKGLLADATSQDDAPTPGYMLNEISRSTLSNYQVNVQMQDYLVSRVAHKHHNVKFKALMIIKHVCRTGRPEFKREMQRKVDPIKECLQFKGTPDPLRGDEPNRRVREAARETLDAIFDSQMPVTTSAVAAANRIQGMGNDWTPPDAASSKSTGILSSIVSTVSSAVLGDGSSEAAYAGHPGATGSFSGSGSTSNSAKTGSYGGPNENSSYSSSGMAGLGNPNFRDARQDKSWVQMASDYVVGKPTPSAPPVSFAAPLNSDYKFATNRGPNAYGSSESQTTTSFQSNFVPDLPLGPPGSGRAGGAAADGSYEKSLIDSLCEPGGLKPVPNEQKLAEFLNAAPSLSAEVIGYCLLDALNSESWQSRTKALMVILQFFQANNCGAHTEFWIQHVEDVRPLLQDSKAGVRTQASKVLKSLSNDFSVATESSVSSKTSTPVVSAVNAGNRNENLLDIMDGVSYSPAPTSTSPVPAAASLDDAGALFAGLSVGGAAPYNSNPIAATVGANAPVNLFLDAAPAPAPISPLYQPKQTSADIFGNMNFNTSPPPPPNNTNVMPQVPPSTVSNAFNFMDDFTSVPSVPQPVQPVQQQSSGGFSFMNDNNTAARPQQSSSSLISSAFVEQPKSNPGNSFQDLTSSYMGNTNQIVSNQPPVPASLNQMMMMQNQTPATFGMNNGGNGGYPGPQYYNRPVGSSILAPGMLNPVAPRKAIPDAPSAGANSGFTFIGGSPQKSGGANDSFSFVTDAMKDLSKK